MSNPEIESGEGILRQKAHPFRELGWLHGLFFSLAAFVILASLILRSDGLSGVYFPGRQWAMPKTCSSKLIFGIDCPSCGLTRAFIAISQGRFQDAWQLNRISFLMYAFVLGQIPWQGMQLIRLWRGRSPVYWPAVYWLPIGLMVLMGLNWLLKITGIWV
jgi:hypothetical protein